MKGVYNDALILLVEVNIVLWDLNSDPINKDRDVNINVQGDVLVTLKTDTGYWVNVTFNTNKYLRQSRMAVVFDENLIKTLALSVFNEPHS